MMNREARLQGAGMTSRRTRDRLINRLRESGVENETVLEVMGNIPRHIFVDEALSSRAYEDTALPIGFGQTISQPLTVARMTEALIDAPVMDRVLEIGTGCGYQTAILANLVKDVYSVERITGLLNRARNNLTELRLRNIRLKHSDGGWGWPEIAPFDGIIVTAGSAAVPQALVDQLAPQGRLIIPVGQAQSQQLIQITRVAEGYETKQLGAVVFVPLLSGVE